MLNGFLEDQAFHDPNQTIQGDIGYLPAQYTEYFLQPTTLNDTRSSRLPITYQDHIFDIQYFMDYFLSEVYKELIYKHFIDPNNPDDLTIITILYHDLLTTINEHNNYVNGDQFQVDRSMVMAIHYDTESVSDNDRIYLASMSDLETQAIFNIAEQIFLGTVTQQTNEEINDILVAGSTGNNTTFYGYKDGSVNVPYIRRLGHLYDGPDFDVLPHPYIEFTVAKSGGYELDFKIWISAYHFDKEYPFTVISAIAPPADLVTLLNLNSLPDIYQALYESRETTLQEFTDKIQSHRYYTGIKGYDVQYVDNINNTNYMTTFLMLYRGKEPGELTTKVAIREYLLNSGVGDLNIWRNLYPSLFIDEMFYLFPLWDVKFTTPNRTIYNSCISEQKIFQIKNIMLSANSYLQEDKFEILTDLYNNGFIIGTRDKNAEITTLEMNQIFPDYTRISSTDPDFSILDVNTRNFIVQLNKALAKSAGEDNELTTTEIEGITYVKFYVDIYEFCVIMRDDYLALVSS